MAHTFSDAYLNVPIGCEVLLQFGRRCVRPIRRWVSCAVSAVYPGFERLDVLLPDIGVECQELIGTENLSPKTLHSNGCLIHLNTVPPVSISSAPSFSFFRSNRPCFETQRKMLFSEGSPRAPKRVKEKNRSGSAKNWSVSKCISGSSSKIGWGLSA